MDKICKNCDHWNVYYTPGTDKFDDSKVNDCTLISNGKTELATIGSRYDNGVFRTNENFGCNQFLLAEWRLRHQGKG